MGCIRLSLICSLSILPVTLPLPVFYTRSASAFEGVHSQKFLRSPTTSSRNVGPQNNGYIGNVRMRKTLSEPRGYVICLLSSIG